MILIFKFRSTANLSLESMEITFFPRACFLFIFILSRERKGKKKKNFFFFKNFFRLLTNRKLQTHNNWIESKFKRKKKLKPNEIGKLKKKIYYGFVWTIRKKVFQIRSIEKFRIKRRRKRRGDRKTRIY